MRLAIMQPYFLPYIGYFQLMAAVDLFIVYDNIKFTKKGWINRNRMLQNGHDVMFSLPLKKDSDYRHVVERELAADFNREAQLRQFSGAYRRAPFFGQTMDLLETILLHPEPNLFRYLRHSIAKIRDHLGLMTEIRTSSDVAIDHDLKGQEKVLALCQAVGARTYINTIGGAELYAGNEFRQRGLDLKFVRSKPFEYAQLGDSFIPSLSIVDVLMFNSLDAVQACVRFNFELA